MTAFVAAGIVACKEKPDGPIELNPKAFLTFEAGTGMKPVAVDGKNWKVTVEAAYEEWIDVEKISGKQFEVTVQANPDMQPRTGSVIVANGEDSKTLEIRQAGIDSDITVEPTLTIEADGGDTYKKTVTVTAEAAWEVDSEDGWLTVEKAADGLSFAVVAVPWGGKEPRTGTIVVDNGVTQEPIEVTQQAGTFEMEEEVMFNWGDELYEYTVEVESNLAGWTATVMSDYTSWLEITKNADNFIIKPKVNDTGAPRTGIITVSNGDADVIVEVTQRYTEVIVGTAGSISKYTSSGYWNFIIQNNVSGGQAIGQPGFRALNIYWQYPAGATPPTDITPGTYYKVTETNPVGIRIGEGQSRYRKDAILLTPIDDAIVTLSGNRVDGIKIDAKVLLTINGVTESWRYTRTYQANYPSL